ncbi:acid protease [Hypoxylon sp. FL0890]|nr:acid protease [Hypoxylon sp. FL0890]
MHSLPVLRSLIVFAVFKLVDARGAFTLERHRTVNLGSRDDLANSARLQWLDDVYEYTTQVKIGTPGQIMTMRIDFENFFTFNTVVPSTNATGCADISGWFNQNVSSTFHVDNVWSNKDGSYAGLLFSDTIEFGGVCLSNYSMTLAYDTTSGSIQPYPDVKATEVDNTEPSLPILYLLGDSYQFPDNPASLMTRNGQIATPAFSLWLEDEGKRLEVCDGGDYAGELLFGAIDAQRYEGDLIGLQTYGANGSPLSPGDDNALGVVAIAMTSLSVSSSTGTDNIWVQGPLLVRVKLGDDLWLSPYLAAQIRNITGAFVRLDETGSYEYTVIPCSMRDSEGYFTFGFGGPDAFKVNVTMRSLVTPPSRKLRELFNSFGDDMCRFGISEVKGYESGFLSSHLLRSVYTVVDLYNNKVAMATVKRNVKEGESNIVTFDGHAAPIPSATMAQNQPSMVSTIAWAGPSQPPSFQAAEGFKILTVSTSPPSSLPTSLLAVPNSAPERPSKPILVGLIVGVSIAAILLVIAAALVWRRWKKRRGLVTRSLVRQQLRNEKPELHGGSVEMAQRLPYEIHGNPLPAELSGVREPSELCGLERYAELPGPPVPAKDR